MRRVILGSVLLIPCIAGCRMPGTAALALGGGDQIKGSGVSKTERRDVSRFTAISVAGSFEVRVRAGKAQQVVVTADDNILPVIKTEVSGETLKVYSDKSYSTKRGVRVDISLQSLRGLTSAGSGDIKIAGVDGDQLSLELAGSGSIHAAGKARSLKASIGGSGNMAVSDLHSQDADVTVAGSGNVEVNTTGKLRTVVSGSGNVRYSGRPKSVSSTVAGSGRVESF